MTTLRKNGLGVDRLEKVVKESWSAIDNRNEAKSLYTAEYMHICHFAEERMDYKQQQQQQQHMERMDARALRLNLKVQTKCYWQSTLSEASKELWCSKARQHDEE
jgi:hypothetical protein